MSQPVLAFKMGSFSLINENLGAALSEALPEYDFQWLDVEKDFLAHRAPLRFLLILEALTRYPRKIRREHFSPLIFAPRCLPFQKPFRRWVEGQFERRKPVFSFQTQSLFSAARKGTPHFLYTDHTYLAGRRYPTPRPLLACPKRWRVWERELYGETDINFVSSEFAAESLREDYGIPAKRVQCVYSGFNIRAEADAAGSSAGPGRILFVGLEWERKGGPELWMAFLRLAREFPRAELHIVGCEPAVSHERAFIHGKVEPCRMPAHFAQADIFCMPSRAEPSAAAVVEAAAFGLPVVTTRVGGNFDRVVPGETGLLVDPENVDELTAALRELLRDPQKARAMGRAGRELVYRNFTWKAVAGRMASSIRLHLEGRTREFVS